MYATQFVGRRQVILYVLTFKDVSQHHSSMDVFCISQPSFGFREFNREFKKTTKATAMETSPSK